MQEKLRNVLAAFAAFNPTVGYCQSMNFVAALLLLQLQDEEEAFWVLATVVTDILPHYYHRSLYGLRIDQVHSEPPVPSARAARLRFSSLADRWLPKHGCAGSAGRVRER